jgi:hypothetical protein
MTLKLNFSLTLKFLLSWALVAHACNPSCCEVSSRSQRGGGVGCYPTFQ